jgi:hypothetical protein
MASESNATLHNAMRLHIDNLRLLAKPLDQLQKEIPSLADLDEGSEANIAEVSLLFEKYVYGSDVTPPNNPIVL